MLKKASFLVIGIAVAAASCGSDRGKKGDAVSPREPSSGRPTPGKPVSDKSVEKVAAKKFCSNLARECDTAEALEVPAFAGKPLRSNPIAERCSKLRAFVSDYSSAFLKKSSIRALSCEVGAWGTDEEYKLEIEVTEASKTSLRRITLDSSLNEKEGKFEDARLLWCDAAWTSCRSGQDVAIAMAASPSATPSEGLLENFGSSLLKYFEVDAIDFQHAGVAHDDHVKGKIAQLESTGLAITYRDCKTLGLGGLKFDPDERSARSGKISISKVEGNRLPTTAMYDEVLGCRDAACIVGAQNLRYFFNGDDFIVQRTLDGGAISTYFGLNLLGAAGLGSCPAND